MGIPIGQQSTAKFIGTTGKICRCEACQTEYVYFVKRTAVGYGSSFLFLNNEGARDRALANGEKKLQRALEQAVEPIPCPHCGWFQANMVAAEKNYRLKFCLWLSLPLSVILMIVWVYLAGVESKHASTVLTSAGVCAVAGIVLGIAWRIKHDPNTGHGGAGSICRERAQASDSMLKTDFDALVRAKQAQNAENPSA